MSYEVNIQEQQDHIRVEVSGERMPGHEEGDAIEVWSRVAKICEAKKQEHTSDGNST